MTRVPLGRSDRAQRPLGNAVRLELVLVEQLDAGHRPPGLDGIELAVARHAEEDEPAVGRLARHRLDGVVLGDAEALRELGDRPDAGRGHLAHRDGLGDRGRARNDRLGSLDVGGPAALAVDELGLAVLGKRHELGGHLAADLARVGHDRPVLQAEALADAAVRARLVVVVLLERLLVAWKE